MIPNGEFKDDGGPLRPRRPWWFVLILILLVLPAFGMPWLLADAPQGSVLYILIKWFPAFLLLAAVCAWYAFPQRRDVGWILVAIMFLSDCALFVI